MLPVARTALGWQASSHRHPCAAPCAAASPHVWCQAASSPSRTTPSKQALLNLQLKHANTLPELLQCLTQHGNDVNEVNIFTATTQAHKLVRQHHTHMETPAASQSKQRRQGLQHQHLQPHGSAMLSEPQHLPPAAENMSSPFDLLLTRLLQDLIQLAQAHTARFTPRHCVSILTAHAWVHRMTTAPVYQSPTTQALLAALCDRLAAQADSTRPVDLSRAIWACAQLGFHHYGLSQAASQTLQAAAAAIVSHTHDTDHSVPHLLPSSSRKQRATADKHSSAEPASSTDSQAGQNLQSLVHLLHTTSCTQYHSSATPSSQSLDSSGALQWILDSMAQGGQGMLSTLPATEAASMLLVVANHVRNRSRDTRYAAGGGSPRLQEVASAATAACWWAAGLSDSCSSVLPVMTTVSGGQHTVQQPGAQATTTVSLPTLATVSWSLQQLVMAAQTDSGFSENSGGGATANSQELPATLCEAGWAACCSLASLASQTLEAAAQAIDLVSSQDVAQLAGALAHMHAVCGGHGEQRSRSAGATVQRAGQHSHAEPAENGVYISEVHLFMRHAAEHATQHARVYGPRDVCDMLFALACISHKHAAHQWQQATVPPPPPGQLQVWVTEAAGALTQAAAAHAGRMPAHALAKTVCHVVSLGLVPTGLLSILQQRVLVAAQQAEQQTASDAGTTPEACRTTSDIGGMPRCDLIEDVSPHQVARLSWALAECHQRDPAGRWTQLAKELETAAAVHAPDMDNQSLVTCLSSLASLGLSCTDLLAVTAPLITPSTPGHTPAHRSATAPGLSPPPATSIHTPRAPLTPQQLALCVWACAKIMSLPDTMLRGMAPLQLFQRAASTLAVSAGELNGQSLAMVAAAYVSAEVHPGDVLLRALHQQVEQRLDTLHPHSLSLLAWALSHYKACDSALLTRMADVLVAHSGPGAGPVTIVPTPSVASSPATGVDTPEATPGATHGGSVTPQHAPPATSVSTPSSVPQPDITATYPSSSAQAQPSQPTTAAGPTAVLAKPVRHPQLMAALQQPAPVTTAPHSLTPALAEGILTARPWGADAVRVGALVGLAVSLAKAGVHHPKLLTTALSRLLIADHGKDPAATALPSNARLSDRAHVRHCICLLWAMAASGHRCHPEDLHQLVTSVHIALTAGSQQVRGGSKGPGATRVDVRLLCMLLQALPELRYQPTEGLLDPVCARVAGSVQQLSTHNLCEVLWAVAALQYRPAQGVLDSLVQCVEQRVLTDQQELITLRSAIKLAWALLCLGQHRQRMARHAVAKVLGAPPTALMDSPRLLRMLIEVQLLASSEARSGGYWRAVSRRWQHRVRKGAPDSLPVHMANAQGYGGAYHAAMSQVVQELPQALAGLGYPHAAWRATPQGELVCYFVAAHQPRLPPSLQPPAPPPVVELPFTASVTSHTQGHSLRLQRLAAQCRVAVVVLCPWHCSTNTIPHPTLSPVDPAGASGTGTGTLQPVMLSHAALHVRLLRRKGFKVVVCSLEEVTRGLRGAGSALELRHRLVQVLGPRLQAAFA